MTTCRGAAVALLVLAAPAGLAAQDRAAGAEQAFRGDVHAAAGLQCASCHEPKAAPARGDDAPIARGAIASLCARCHSDAAYMRRFDPQVRVEQFAQYLTSAHGRAMAKGETRVATCSDCHGAHGVTRVRDPRSPVSPLRAASTCARCHADGERMAAFGREPSPFADWSTSVHATALLTRNDTSAPTCHTCHGSHGAVPPGVTEVATVCSQCHVREADLFRASPKKAIFDGLGQGECIVCHGHHAIQRPTDGLVGLDTAAVCATCHDRTTNGSDTVVEMRLRLDELAAAIAAAEDLIGQAEHAGMLVDEGRVALQEAREQQIQSRVLVHTFAANLFAGAASGGIDAARRGQRVGEEALGELQFRRRGLAVATIFILGFLITLGLKIRRLSPPEP
jgi:predicted CXXCH cytochrome family protein